MWELVGITQTSLSMGAILPRHSRAHRRGISVPNDLPLSPRSLIFATHAFIPSLGVSLGFAAMGPLFLDRRTAISPPRKYAVTAPINGRVSSSE